jgi:hypothetical protein
MSLVTESWLMNNSVRRCILAKVGVYKIGADPSFPEISTGETFVYISNANYVTTTSDVLFRPVISGGLQFLENIDRNGNAFTSWGNLELNNADGSYDNWFDDAKYIWVNRTIQLYYGDPEWITTNYAQIITDFELIFDGVIVDVSSRNRNRLNIMVRDKMERLNNPVTEDKLGEYGTWVGGYPNKDALKPLVFGEIHNSTPLQTNPATLEYMANYGVTEQLVEVRDNGVPVYTYGSTTATAANIANLATLGTFTLTTAPAGTITTTIQGVKKSINLTNGNLDSVYKNNVANLVTLITTQFGNPATKLVTADLDLTNLAAFESANAQSVGLLINSTITVKEACGALVNSLGAQLVFTRQGKLQILRFGVPTGTSVAITNNDIIQNSLVVTEKITVVAASKLGFCKNWTVQRDLTTGIPESHKEMFSEEWMTQTSAINTTVRDLYKLTDEPDQKNTMLLVQSEALTEADRLTTFYSSPKTIFSFIGTPRMQILKLGQAVTLTHNRFGLSSGKAGQVVSLSPDWSSGKVTVGVLV